MPVTAVVGAQWGDEGKGRIIDYLAQKADLVMRFQGGANAGHTVVNAIGKFALHLVPSGIFNPETRCIVGTGAVVDPAQLLNELEMLERAGVATGNLFLSERCHVVMPYHLALDNLEEEARTGGAKIGTTKRGIGPTYADRAARTGIRLGDLTRPEYLEQRLETVLPLKNRLLAELGGEPFVATELLDQARQWTAALGGRIVDTLPLIKDAITSGREVLLEGQLGVMRDLDWGIYPFVTSSNPLAGFASVGAGFPPTAITEVIGVVKAYSTAVGAGPLPVELLDEVGERLRYVGQEYGATTGRPRRCGWFDGVAIPYAAWLNGFTGLAVTKLDVLDGMEELKICVGYRFRGEVLTHVPTTSVLEEVEPVYEAMPGWSDSTTEARTWAELPPEAQRYLDRIADLAGVPIRYVSVGAERNQLIVMETAG